MSDLLDLKKAIGLIVVGLYEKERGKKQGEYFYSKKLMHGINMFQQLHYKYNPAGFDFSKMHEQAFLVEYAMNPVWTWFDGWKNTEELELEEQAFYQMGALIGDSGFQTFHITEDCEDYLEHVEKDIIGGVEQRAVYDFLKTLLQEDYVFLRKYFIEHLEITEEELRELKTKYVEQEVAWKAIEAAYEEILENKSKYRYRLRRGVMRYIVLPGKLELEIQEYCEKNKFTTRLWPHMDMYDVEIDFGNGEVWAVDAKMIKEPYFLKEAIKQENGCFPLGDCTKGVYVIPDEYVEQRPDYITIIEKEIAKKGVSNVFCMSWKSLKKEIRERAKYR